jgi:[acyl-carrier-protein] S-malonyltransferase/trans-AT polyketide synthase/acyltransferase/oxidoreductase domain-containing protein
MAGDFVSSQPAAAAVFSRASEAIGVDLLAICLTPEEPRLNLTEFTQPCILTAEIAMLEAVRSAFGFAADRFGGHSLGEYSALVAAGAIPLESAARLVRRRGQLMQEAVPVGRGAMAAVIQPGLSAPEIERVAAAHDIDVANLNSPSQLVLSGSAEGVAAATAALQAQLGGAGGRVVPLEVSAPFHSRAMAVIEPTFRALLREESVRFDAPRSRAVTSNFLGGFHDGSVDGLVDALTRQISGPVRWIDNMRALAGDGGAIFEIGPNRPLKGFFRELGHEVTPIMNLRAAEKALGGAVA